MPSIFRTLNDPFPSPRPGDRPGLVLSLVSKSTISQIVFSEKNRLIRYFNDYCIKHSIKGMTRLIVGKNQKETS